MEGLLILLVLGGIAATAYLVAENRAGVESATVKSSPEQIISLAVASIPKQTASLRSSWMPAGHDGRSATFTYHRRKSILLSIFLLLFFLIPGILYLIFGGKSQTLRVSIIDTDEASGTTTVQVAASGGVARRRGRSFLQSLTAGQALAATGGQEQEQAGQANAAPEAG